MFKRSDAVSQAIETVQKYFDSHKSHDPAAMRAMMTDDYTFDGPMMQAGSADEMMEKMQAFGCEMTNTIHSMVADGNTVAVQFTCDFKAPFSATLEMAEWLTVEGGKVKSSKLFYDTAKMPAMPS